MLTIALALFALFVIRLSFIERFPAFEWDESVYFCIIEGTRDTGRIRLVADELVDSSFYAFHPPFYFWLAGGIATFFPDVSIMTLARIINAVAFCTAVSVPALLLAWRYPMLRMSVLCSVVLVGFDAWIILSNRTGWFENTQFLLVVLTQMAMFKLLTSGALRYATAVGLLAGAAIIFKHIGAWMVLQWLMLLVLCPGYRLALVRAAWFTCIVIVAYGVLQYLRGGDLFLEHTFHQFSRATGETKAPGVNLSIGQSLDVFREAYGIYWPSLLMTLIAGTVATGQLLGVRITRAGLVYKPEQESAAILLGTWLLAAGLGLVLIQLRNPHYYFLVFVPAALYLGYILGGWLTAGRFQRYAATFILVLLIGGNVVALGNRLTWEDGVLTRYFQGPGADLAGRRVLTEEPLACLTSDIGAYRDIRLGRNRDPALLSDGTLDAVVLLSSRTYRPAVSQEWQDVLAAGWVQTYSDSDWKWRLELWEPKKGVE